MTLKTRKKHQNQNKETQDCPRLDPHLSWQRSRLEHVLLQQGNQSGGEGEGLAAPRTASGELQHSRGNRQGGEGND